MVGPTGRAEIRLVLDTGAVLTTLVPSVAEAIGYSEASSRRRTVMRTAAAEERGYLVQLVELSTLGVTIPAVHVNVSELGHGIDGLLGMNVLLDYDIEIRTSRRRILIERI